MNEEEIYFWLKVFCIKNQSFIHGERKISLFTVFNYLLELKKENQKLKGIINEYEDPEDLTLMFMYCDERAKDKIKELQEKINKAIELLNNPWSFESGNKKVDEITYKKKREVINLLTEVE